MTQRTTGPRGLLAGAFEVYTMFNRLWRKMTGHWRIEQLGWELSHLRADNAALRKEWGRVCAALVKVNKRVEELGGQVADLEEVNDSQRHW